MNSQKFDKDWQQIIADRHSSYNRDINDWHSIYDWIAQRYKGILLDVGCGMGHLIKTINNPNAIGIDISYVAILMAQQRCPNNKFYVSDIYETDIIEQGDYDSICFTQILEHVDDDIALIKRIPKGKIVFISVPKEKPNIQDQHVRFFPNLSTFKKHFKGQIKIIESTKVGEFNFLCLYGIKK